MQYFRKGFVLPIIITCTVVFLIFIYWFFFIFSTNGSCIQVLQEARNPLTRQIKTFPTPCSVPLGWQKTTQVTNNKPPSQSDPTVNWKTYTNGAFSFKYPSDWDAKDTDSQTIVLNPKTRQPQETSHDTILIYRIANPNILTISQIIHRPNGSGMCCLGQFADSLIKKTESVKISGVEGERYYLGDGIYPNDETYVLQSGYVYNIENNGGLNFRNIYNQIISTFKFTDETANWKTYMNKDLGFNFQYPTNFSVNEDNNLISILDQDKNLEATVVSFDPRVVGISYCQANSQDKSRCQIININGLSASIDNRSNNKKEIILKNLSIVFYLNKSMTDKLSLQILSTFKFLN